LGLAWAFLAKGPGGWLVPGLTVLGYLASERRWRELLRWQMWAGFAIVLGAVGSWIAAVVRSSDGAHALRILLWSNVIGRAVALSAPDASEYAAGHKNWVGKYLVELPYYLLPWTLLFFAALRRASVDVAGSRSFAMDVRAQRVVAALARTVAGDNGARDLRGTTDARGGVTHRSVGRARPRSA
jgi:4-amino-4-deoxy-L-arabinose transferase-like glycosyltransferase